MEHYNGISIHKLKVVALLVVGKMRNIFQQIWNKKHFDNSGSCSFKEIIGQYENQGNFK